MISKKIQSNPINFPRIIFPGGSPGDLIPGDFRRDAADLPLGFRLSFVRDAAGIFLEILRYAQNLRPTKNRAFADSVL